jgi:branched-chain amino acid transport system ATP-binding protein
MSAATKAGGIRVEGIDAFYGKSHVLRDVSLEIGGRGVVALLGRNGAGKTTTIKAITGLVPPARGRILLDGANIAGLRPDQITRRGIACVPEERNVFTHLSVEQNLRIAERRASPWSIERVVETFPLIKPLLRRMGGHLSGGEQQIVAIARALLLGPKVLLLDEPSQGLAPVMTERVLEVLATLKGEGLAMLLVEQKLDMVVELAGNAYILDNGRVVHSGPAAELGADSDIVHRYLGVGA